MTLAKTYFLIATDKEPRNSAVDGCSYKQIATTLTLKSLALSFLHDSAKLFHCNLNPLAIAVTDKGSWKLAGLEFSTKLDDDNFKWADNYPTLAQPSPAYIPPDLFENKIIDTSGELIF